MGMRTGEAGEQMHLFYITSCRLSPAPRLLTRVSAMTESLLSRFDSLALTENDLVVIVGLEFSRQHNFEPARVLDSSGERLKVQLLHGSRKGLSIRRGNLLKMSRAQDRTALLTRIVWERQLELRVARAFLVEKFHGEEGLALEVAKHFSPRETLALTSGYSLGRMVPEWSAVGIERGGLVWRPLHGRAPGGPRVHGADRVADGIVRIDCAVVSVGAGRFVVAGGCDDHPGRTSRFFASAFEYDAIARAAAPLPAMPTARHGCGGAHIDGKVYIVGGTYVQPDGAADAVVLDLGARGGGWQPLEDLPPRAGGGPSSGGQLEEPSRNLLGAFS
ncbi:hypothetical protein EMIHUDRAFT_248062 [Emiliania huxleyi CCMP1516]|uniref:Uncharacterized protein n=2 Tax=Emiliania huxleyi TaxID=2903 RepID=A0A0D3IIX8_EMIH1|nr:hypothetical protein EMIHUDRAFT_248062 [Emiliania huxleyi CCMP1516]EOD11213.1 hypothetical protein EMIHUDRAFT_248062 [Emiliania huxleyi CCMP1516]|eukprot:XP_005763642.1 hypothetical protein EMIHUDRAFT_248062 [Emiliania huxleyi CCMP1516]